MTFSAVSANPCATSFVFLDHFKIIDDAPSLNTQYCLEAKSHFSQTKTHCYLIPRLTHKGATDSTLYE